MEKPYHVPVLLQETIDGLQIKSAGIYVDLTFGGGGHSREILQHLGKKGMLIAFDHDGDAMANTTTIVDKRFKFVRGNYRYLHNFLRYLGIAAVDGIVADLGVSWHQFDTAQRGFSFRFDNAMNMSMNAAASLNAADVVNTYPKDDLARILRDYGEIEKSHHIAKMIVQARESAYIKTSTDFINAIKTALPKYDENKMLARIFQALRIEVNDEINALEQGLRHCAKSLRSGGRLAVISYHSLEDRMVKNFMRYGNRDGNITKNEYGNTCTPFSVIACGKKQVITASEQEIAENNRARSAKLRIAEKC
jgi:16S rRNA (cytosine1402-N4)-methyltransferase